MNFEGRKQSKEGQCYLGPPVQGPLSKRGQTRCALPATRLAATQAGSFEWSNWSQIGDPLIGVRLEIL
jgi:hypothetical protein